MCVITLNKKLTSLIYLVLHVCSVTCWSSQGEIQVRTAIFNGSVYHRFIRPVSNMTAKVGLSLMSVNDLNMIDQSMTVMGWLTMEWGDYRLKWEKANYDDVDQMFATDRDVWKPELFIDNSLDDVSILQGGNSLFRVSNTGRVDWEHPRIFVTTCTVDTTFYPFDTQECAIGVTSSAHTVEEMKLLHLWENISVKDLVENGEWIYVTSRVETSVTKMTTGKGEKEYSLLKFIVVLTRRYDYYVTNVILPVITTSLLTILVFILPVDSGEKVSYALTVLLALAVLLTLIADSMPSTSIYVSILSVYLAYTLVMGVLAVGLTVLVLRIQSHDSEKPVPVWLHKLTRRLFARGACWKGFFCCRNRKEHLNTALKSSNEGHVGKYGYDQRRGFLMYSWSQIAEILDWFLFVLFSWSTIIVTFAFMVILKVNTEGQKC